MESCMLETLMKFPHSQPSSKPNKIAIPVVALDINDENAELFNKIYFWIRDTKFNKIVRTKSGGISIAKGKFRPPCWDVSASGSCVELTIIIKEGMWRIQFRQSPQTEEDKKKHIFGSQAFRYFVQELRKNGVDINDYAIDNGVEVKKTIPKQLVSCARPVFLKVPLENVHHVDYHSSHMAGLANTHPEFKSTVEYFYNHRKERPEYKAVLTNTWGYMQSTACCQAKWAHLSKDALEDTNERVLELAKRVEAAGGTILLYNTDGFWYMRKEGPYHGEGEGKALGQWENDHINCKFRMKSAGAYEYMEDGVYTPVVRGQTKLDKRLPRSQWEWGSIFTNEASAVLAYYWTEEEGLKIKEEFHNGNQRTI